MIVNKKNIDIKLSRHYCKATNQTYFFTQVFIKDRCFDILKNFELVIKNIYLCNLKKKT